LRTVTANGHRIAYTRSGENGQPIVLIHGLGGSAEATYGDVIERLQPEMRVLAFDNRGVGASDQPADGYSLVNLAHDTHELMREVGIEAAHIVGHSFGGMIAQQFALDFPDATLSLVLADCPGEQSEAARKNFEARAKIVEEQGTAAIVAGVIQNGIGAQAKERRPEAVERFRQSLLTTAPGPYAASCRAAGALNLLARLSAYSKPVLVLWGDQDNVPRAATEQLAAAFPHGRFEVIPDSGHNSPLENPDAFAQHILAFVREKAPVTR
jgi:3-oxoadipate enol-lactonase